MIAGLYQRLFGLGLSEFILVRISSKNFSKYGKTIAIPIYAVGNPENILRNTM